MSHFAYAYRYRDEDIQTAKERGYDDAAHREALDNEDEEAISLTHPYNWLTAEEVEEATA